MFGKKKDKPQIDKEQLELIQNAQRRIKQKKRLYAHFVIFLIGSVLLIVANIGLGIGKEIRPFDVAINTSPVFSMISTEWIILEGKGLLSIVK